MSSLRRLLGQLFGLGERRAAGELAQRFLEPGFQRVNERPGFLLPGSPAFVDAVAADLSCVAGARPGPQG